MKVLDLCNELCPNKLPVKLDQRLGEGADGEVFSIVDDPNKVIKLSIKYEIFDRRLFKDYETVQKSLNYLIYNNTLPFAKVYQQSYLINYWRTQPTWGTRKQKFIIYYYIMEKLNKITEDEEKVFHTILSHQDNNIKKDIFADKIKKDLEGLSMGLDFDAERIMLFCDNIRSAPIQHLDLHSRNIMKNEDGYFKLIDLDRISIGENFDKLKD